MKIKLIALIGLCTIMSCKYNPKVVEIKNIVIGAVEAEVIDSIASFCEQDLISEDSVYLRTCIYISFDYSPVGTDIPFITQGVMGENGIVDSIISLQLFLNKNEELLDFEDNNIKYYSYNRELCLTELRLLQEKFVTSKGEQLQPSLIVKNENQFVTSFNTMNYYTTYFNNLVLLPFELGDISKGDVISVKLKLLNKISLKERVLEQSIIL